MTIKYYKMHGLGNDVVITHLTDLGNITDLSRLAKSISHRRLGIGCDQFIIFSEDNGDYEMQVYNGDGGVAKTCGNATRCLAKLIYNEFKHSENNRNPKEITIKVSDRKLKCIILSDGEVSVNMGAVSFDKAWMPAREKLWDFASKYQIDPKELICVDVSNPHLVIFTALSEADKEIIGAKLQGDEFFLGGINVNFANVLEDKVFLKVWERGTGFTLACGSGACASFAAAKKLGFVNDTAVISFELGNLKMREENENIIMQGPASMISKGEYYYE